MLQHTSIALKLLAYALVSQPDSLPQRWHNISTILTHRQTHPIERAISHDDKELVQILIDCGEAHDAQENGASLLEKGTYQHKTRILKLFLENGIYTGIDNALWIAVKHNLPEISHLLIQHGARLEQRSQYGRSLLHVAAEHNSIEAARVFITNINDINAQCLWHETPIHKALSRNHKAFAEFLYDYGAYVDTYALYIAASQNQIYLMKRFRASHNIADNDYVPDIIERLIDIYNLPRNDVHQATLSPLFIASCSGFSEMVRFLIKERHATTRLQETPLHYASTWHTADVLIQYGANPYTRDCYGRTPLHTASQRAYPGAIKRLLQAFSPHREGDTLEIYDTYGRTPLDYTFEQLRHVRRMHRHTASKIENIATYLLACKASGDARMLITASYLGNLRIMHLLLQQGIRIDNRCYGTTPLHAAAQAGNVAAVTLLIKRGGKPCIKASGETPLHTTITCMCNLPTTTFYYNTYLSIIKLLTRNAYDINTQDASGRTPMQLIIKKSQHNPQNYLKAAARILIESGAHTGVCNEHTRVISHDDKDAWHDMLASYIPIATSCQPRVLATALQEDNDPRKELYLRIALAYRYRDNIRAIAGSIHDTQYVRSAFEGVYVACLMLPCQEDIEDISQAAQDCGLTGEDILLTLSACIHNRSASGRLVSKLIQRYAKEAIQLYWRHRSTVAHDMAEVDMTEGLSCVCRTYMRYLPRSAMQRLTDTYGNTPFDIAKHREACYGSRSATDFKNAYASLLFQHNTYQTGVHGDVTIQKKI